ncbi:hypothetical protein HNR01_002464 [Methylorubrum rhodesianum]|uniref:Uncharacterized protein n=1 Tax=Methylorubrum rhodesianum TaxID=29427 RepID=A0ABU9ZEP5_9HYPH|nr:hypothetical protein [Methylorubrum rhodesianum]MBI1688869.1 hypothetical protein [Methylorubrum sp. DB1722]
MTLVDSSLWPAPAALVLGLVVGAPTGLPRRGLALAAAGLLLAGLASPQTAPSEPGLWIETAALLLGTDLAGCALGGLGRAVSGGPL